MTIIVNRYSTKIEINKITHVYFLIYDVCFLI